MIEFDDVHKSYGGRDKVTTVALAGITLTIPPRKMYAIVGPSGSGKSTLLHLASGLTRADRGTVSIDGRTIDKMSDDELTLFRRREIGIVFQTFNLNNMMNAFDNVAMPLKFDGRAAGEIRDRVVTAMRHAEIEEKASSRPNELSGGEQQRVAIARALVTDPKIILADEPTGNLDRSTAHTIVTRLREINQKTGVTIMMVTHDYRWAAVCDEVVRIVDGIVDQRIEIPDDAPAA